MLARIPTRVCFGLNNALTRPDPEIAWKWPGKALQASAGAFRAQPQSWGNMSMRKPSTLSDDPPIRATDKSADIALVHARIVLYRIMVTTAMHILLRRRAVPSVKVALGAMSA